MESELNSQQRAAIEFAGGHVLVLAGAGTGKTRTIIERAAHLIRNGVQPRRILMLTFTRRAAREMTDRLSSMVGLGAGEITAGTFHHFCLLSMRKMGKQFGIENATVIDRDDQVQLMKLVRAPYRQPKEQFPKAARLVDLYSYSRNTNQSPFEYLEKFSEFEDELLQRVCKIFKDYETRKKQSGYLDYDDILHRFARKLHSSSSIRERLGKLYDHILVDEMQDTNPLQWLILDGLRDPAKLFCVGDDAQSIYAFRGADFRNVHSFTERIPDSTVLRLEENYRSTQEILDLANWLLDESPLDYNKHLTAFRSKGLMPKFIEFETDFDEAKWIVNDLVERHENGRKWHEQMIITRTGFVTRALEAELVERKIPYRYVGGTGLLQAAHVKDLFAMIRSAANHHDELAWARYLTMWPKIGDTTAAKLISGLNQHAVANDAINELRRKLEDRPEILAGIELVQRHWKEPPTVINQAGKFLGKLLDKKYHNWKIRRKDFDLLATVAQRFKSLISFLETYTLDPISTTEAERMETDDAVTLITVHSAKGTEAPVCYLIRTEPGMYPHVRSLGVFDEEEEERRVLYVAMTRAQNELILTRTCSQHGAMTIYGGFVGEHSQSGTAYFLEDIPDQLIDWNIEGFPSEDIGDFDVIHPFGR